MQHNLRKGFLLSLIATVLLSTNFITGKYGLRGFNPWTFGMIWCAAGAVYSFIILLVSGRVGEIALPRRALPGVLGMGLSSAASTVFGWAALRLLNPSFSAFLWRFSPILTIVLGAIFLSEKLRRRLLWPAALMIAGGFMSTLTGWHVVILGTALTMVACCAVATERLFAKKMVSKIHPNILVFYRFVIAGVVVTLVALAIGKVDFRVEGKYWVVLLLGAFFGECMGFALMFRSYLYWDLSDSSIVNSAEPLFVLPLAYIVFTELPVGMALVGGLMILAGCFWLALVHSKDKINPS